MATTTHDVAAKSGVKSSVNVFGNLKYAWMAMGVYMVYAISLRVYQQWAAWYAGLDSTDPIFDEYWMVLFYWEVVLEAAGCVLLWGYLWKSRDLNVFNISVDEELKRYFTLVGWIFVYALAVYMAASFFAEQDASWHQVVVRDTSFTPSHIVLFYGTMPVYIMIGVGGFMYARTRLPEFASKLSIPYLFAVIGPFMILPNVGYNEWGHAFWLMEEYFTAPLHWGFAVLGWTVLMLAGLAVQVIVRLALLMKMSTEGKGGEVCPLRDETLEYMDLYNQK
jgi:methane/ammonia monooxygenase subunit C